MIRNRIGAQHIEEYTGTMWVYLDEALRPYEGANILTEVEVTVEVSFENGPDGRTWEVIDWSATDTSGDSVEVDHEVALSVATDNV